MIAQSRKLIYVSRVIFSSYDTVMKTMLERAIPSQQAFIRLYHGEVHHIQQNVIEKDALILTYGNLSKEEKIFFDVFSNSIPII